MLAESRPQFRFPDYRGWRKRRPGSGRWFWPLALQIDFPPATICPERRPPRQRKFRCQQLNGRL
jgi:hypothetical protein